MNPMPGIHSGRFLIEGEKVDKKGPGMVALLKLPLARSISVTKWIIALLDIDAIG